MSYLHLKPTFNCLVKLENLEKTLDKNKTYSFLVNSPTLNIIVYPIQNEEPSLPFSFYFDENNPICKKNIDVITFPNQNYLIVISPFFIGNPKYFGVKSKTLNFGQANHTLYYTLNTFFNIKLENDTTSCEYSFSEKISSLFTKTVDKNVLIYAKIENSSNYIFCNISFNNNKYELITLEKIDILEETENSIFTYKNLNDISHHGQVNKYTIKPNYTKVSYLVYNNNFPVIIKHKELVPFAFFEAIKIENFKLARSYLTERLSNKLTNNHFKKFFGKFTNICLPLTKEDFEDEISLIYEKQENFLLTKFAKNFKIILNENNKIENIEEL